MADARAPGVDGLSSAKFLPRIAAPAAIQIKAHFVTWLHAQYGVFGIGEIAEPRTLRPLEIFRLAAAAKESDEARYRAIRIDDNDGPPAQREVPADRPGEAGEVRD